MVQRIRLLVEKGGIPALVDPNGPDGHPISIFESEAILLYLARKNMADICQMTSGAELKSKSG
jgi:glutathione S-transferase